MHHPNQPSRRLALAAPFAVVTVAALVACLVRSPTFAREPDAAQPAAASKVPPVPDGSPEELMDYLKGLRKSNERPSSREAAFAYFRELSTASLEAAEKILVQVKPQDPVHDEAAKVKLESLAMLGRLGDEKAAEQLTKYASDLIQGPSKNLARDANQMLLLVEAQKVLQGDAAGAPALIKKIEGLLAENPDDPSTAQLAVQLAGAFEHMPGGEDSARAAYAAFGPLLAKSSNESIRSMAENFEGVLRRLNLPGNPIEISGTLLSGSPLDPKSLAGKVVLVDFWATWCGPCIAEIPNVLEQYEKYHDKGFEVIGVSLDDDLDALKSFVETKKIPWPILFEKPEGAGWRHPLATKYGISGIPTVILVGRDGKVISLDVRGEKLGMQLDKLFSVK